MTDEVTSRLKEYGNSMLLSNLKDFNTGDKESEALLRDVAHYPHAFLIACVCDRQMAAERAWRIPNELKKRLGTFEFDKLAVLPENAFVTAFNEPTRLHRFNDKMAHLVYTTIQKIKSDYQGNAAKVWSGCPSSALIVYRLLQFEGFGQKIATMAANILVRDFKIKVSDKNSIDISLDALVPRVLKRLYGLSNSASGEELIYFTRSMHPEYPGIFDFYAWKIGRQHCSPNNPSCNKCPMSDCCAHNSKVEQS
jgi:uncharacterized HhH-GPD family protein